MGSDVTVKLENNLYKENEVFKAVANVFKVFSNEMLSGNPEDALALHNVLYLLPPLLKNILAGKSHLERH